MNILDFGAGWKAIHTASLRAIGLNVTAYDFGRNFDPTLHDHAALTRCYDLVFASNVLNVHITAKAIRRTLAQICLATRTDGLAMANYPESPRKMPELTFAMLDEQLHYYFRDVDPEKGVWWLRRPIHFYGRKILEIGDGFTTEELHAANVRPGGAVGPHAIVPRLVQELAITV